ncbi:phycocyanobilin:ferredoxin oxidoreductase [Synechococcus sp. RSCCF101]|uniref:phycocyanobilin:ferredoxin oxidoreductase n=1 Tax=Synechococcus sp. RSCCF101 TaxID=2511069 RepID=UPI001248E362|nr:phycocyanobilin:ferredoxin oxidoreductase [Synechococcus sp. RSCCF101]QEY31603.1 phycocyanobilin:ferredoxin oxidoreductase [Synechococcus sp. RSCCF101]
MPIATGSDASTDTRLNPLADALADLITESWSRLPDLEPLPIDPELEAISGSLDGDDLFIRNSLRRARGYRKMHLETARLGAGLQILHCVFFPDPRHDLPLFGADVVASRAGVSAAIADLSPVAAELPAALSSALRQRPEPPYSQPRELPAWGDIFSPFVRFVRPVGPEEEGWFLDDVRLFLDLIADAVASSRPQASDDPATVHRYEMQLSYCLQQKRNDKTRRALEKAFNPSWADRYIETLLFDDPPRPA